MASRAPVVKRQYRPDNGACAAAVKTALQPTEHRKAAGTNGGRDAKGSRNDRARESIQERT